MPATLATLNAITKEIYEGDVREQLNNDVVTLRRIEKTSRGVGGNVGGRYVTFPIHTRRNAGIGARNELEQLPAAGQQGTAAARIGLKYLYGAVKLSGQAIALIDKDYQSFQSSLELELNGLKSDLAKDQNRQVYGTQVGVVGKVTATTAGNTITVDRPDLFDVGMVVDYVLANSTVSQVARNVTSISLANKTVTIDGAAIATPAVGDFFVRTGNLNREWNGFTSIVSNTGTLYNIDPTVESVWQSVVNNNGGASTAVSENMFMQMADQIRVNGGKTTVIFTSLGVRRSYASLLQQQRQFVNTKEFDGGFSGIGFITDRGEIPIVTDAFAPPSTAWFINEDEIKEYREDDWSWMDMDGNKWERVTGYDAYQGMMYQYSELGTGRRNTHGVIQNITES
jgi:hypothetical protein